MTNYPWYEIVSEEIILQGDLFEKVPFEYSKKIVNKKKATAAVDYYDVIVLSQSCDLVAKKLNNVIVCPYWTLEEIGQANKTYQSKKGKEKLRRGEVIGYHLLNKCELEDFKFDYLIADFKSVFSLPLEYLFKKAEEIDKRLRILPPYREHLSQAFARFIMRVGLPTDIPKFD